MNAEFGDSIPGKLGMYFKNNMGLSWQSFHDLSYTNFFHKNQYTLSLNSNYMVIFKNSQDDLQFATIARQICPDRMKFLMWAFKVATSSPHSCLMLDMKLDTEERFWFTKKPVAEIASLQNLKTTLHVMPSTLG